MAVCRSVNGVTAMSAKMGEMVSGNRCTTFFITFTGAVAFASTVAFADAIVLPPSSSLAVLFNDSANRITGDKSD